METRSMLNFGLMALLEKPVSPLINAVIIQCLAKVFQTVDQREHFSYQYIHTLARNFTFERHVKLALGQFLQRNSNTPAPYAKSNEGAWFSFISSALNRLTSMPKSLKSAEELDSIYRLLVLNLCNSPSVCLQVNLSNFTNSLNVEVFTKEFLINPDETLLGMLLQSSLSNKSHIAPTAMRLVWSLVLNALRLGDKFSKVLAVLHHVSPGCKTHTIAEIGGTCLAQLWLPQLRVMCIDSPSLVADSNILQVMLTFYLHSTTEENEERKFHKGVITALRELQDVCLQNMCKMP
ncbi:hypothetical protein B0J17DRAFT_662607 [Rhizoctonia solani]|nr:hypothetical protein B0J17DRAFT_662607 [Rhizoctonia solani]